MSWTVQFIISVVILAAAIFAVIYCEKNKIKRHKLLRSFNILFIGVAVSAFFLYMPYYYNASATSFRGPQAVLVSLYSVLRSFTLDGDYSFFMETVAAGGNVFNTVYLTYTLVIMVAAPFFTFGVVLSFFKDVNAYIRYFVRRNKETYIFSEINERSVALAKDLRKNNPDVLLVFAGVNEAESETEKELVEQAAEIDAICFKKDILSIRFRLDKLTKKTWFFVVGGNETENLRQTLKLIAEHKDRENTMLYLFSTATESELVLASTPRGKMTVRRIDEIHSLISRLLYDEGHLLFDSAKADESGTKCISAVIVGLGQYGTTMLRALSWYGQMVDYKLKITAFDKDKNAESRVAYLAPEMIEKENQGVIAEGHPHYEIKVHSDIDANTHDFAEKIMELKDATYVFVALGTDEDNVRVAADLRMRFERLRIKPVIVAVVHSSEERAALEGIKNHKNQTYDIRFIGDIDSSYTEKVIIDSEVEDAALKCHMAWDNAKEEEFWDIEYNYRSSVATALHKKARIHCNLQFIDKPEEEMTEEEKKRNKAIEDLEHCRWFAYMRSEGFVYSGSDDSSSRNELGKMHHNMVPTHRLTDEDLDKDRRVGKA